tara:strand:+ start:499 stop:879 length:381 start_codon:yes stop_codon:yes gene_type:complete
MKITKRQLRRIIREAGEFSPRYKGDTPAKQGADEYAARKRKERGPQVNMDFQRNDPGADQVLKIPSDPSSLAEDAAHAALFHIQDAMGIESGDNASMWGSGEEWDQLISILEDYIKFEIETDHQYR